MNNKIKRLIKEPLRVFLLPTIHLSRYIKDDKRYLRLRYLFQMGRTLHLDKPRTFNEKLQWLKIYDRKPEYTTMVDKYAVKQYVADKIGSDFVIPLIGAWDSVSDIDWDRLPNRFVLKTTHGGGGSSVIICKDKLSLDINQTKELLQYAMSDWRMDFYVTSREWPYKNVRKRIIAEEYLDNEGKDLTDYKVHCFNGVPRFILHCSGRFSSKPMVDDFYDVQWNLIPVQRPGHPVSSKPEQRPNQLNEILRISRILSENIPFVRCDFYISNNKIYFGELTFYPASGFLKFIPDGYDSLFGDWIELPK